MSGSGKAADAELFDCWYTAIWHNYNGSETNAKFFLCPSAVKPEAADGSGHPFAAYDASYPIAIDVSYVTTPPNPPKFSGEHFWAGTNLSTNQMKRFCMDRHDMSVNWTFMDSSVRRVGLKQLWDLPFHRNWNSNHKDTEAFMTSYYPRIWNSGWMKKCRKY